MYHRIADPAVDPWGLAVAPDRFEGQVEVLRGARQPFAMTEFVNRLENGTLPANAVAVTFDDGYVDNLDVAKPRLERAGVPATVFITSGKVGSTREFWWDELARLMLGYRDDLDRDVQIAEGLYRITLKPLSGDESAFDSWLDWRQPRTEREYMYLKVWELMQPLPDHERERAMSIFRQLLKGAPANPADFPMNVDELKKLADDGLIEIGAHSVTHPDLTALPADEKGREMTGSKRDCERFVERPVHGFAYPHGRFDDDTIAAVREAGFRFSCSTNAQIVETEQFDRFALPRLHVMNWTAEEFERELSKIRSV